MDRKGNDQQLSELISNLGLMRNKINKEKIQSDLNSPSAFIRLRAINALKNPENSSYHFDVPHTMEDIITPEEKASTSNKPKTLAEVMKDVIIYVEVFQDKRNISENIKNHIKEKGIRVNNKFFKNTTHLVFKNGRQQYYDKAKSLNIPIVSVLWIEGCRKHMTLLNPNGFEITNKEKYENPTPRSKKRRQSISIENSQNFNENSESFQTIQDTNKNQIEMIKKNRRTICTNILLDIDKLSNLTIREIQDMEETLLESNFRSIDSFTNESAFNIKNQNMTINDIESMDNTLMDVTNNVLQKENTDTGTKKQKIISAYEHDTVDHISSETGNDNSVVSKPVAASSISKKKRKLYVSNPIYLEEIDSYDNVKDIENVNHGDHVKVSQTKTKLQFQPQSSQSQSQSQRQSQPKSDSDSDFVTPSLLPKKRKRSSEKKKLRYIVITKASDKNRDFVKKVINKLGEAKLEDKVTNCTTHVISFKKERTMNLLRGMIRGLWILNENWIADSLTNKRWLNEESYEMTDFSNTILITRSARHTLGKKYRMSIFNGLGPIYVSKNSSKPYEHLIELIKLCYGKIAKTIDEAKYIIGECKNVKAIKNDDDDNNVKNIKYFLSPEWILDSIMNNRLQKKRNYIIRKDTPA